MSTTITETNAAATAAFEDRIMNAALGWFDLTAVHLGSQLGWYAALAQSDGLTAEELAARTGTHARYAQEWLEQQAASGFLRAEEGRTYAERRFTLAPVPRRSCWTAAAGRTSSRSPAWRPPPPDSSRRSCRPTAPAGASAGSSSAGMRARLRQT